MPTSNTTATDALPVDTTVSVDRLAPVLVRLGLASVLLARSLARFGIGPRDHHSVSYFAFLFKQQGLPAPTLFGWAITLAQLTAGLLLLVGVLTRVGGLLGAGAMGTMAVLVRLPTGVDIEFYVAAAAGLGLALALWGAGQFSLERAVLGRELRPLGWLSGVGGAEGVRERLDAFDSTEWAPVPARLAVAVVGIYEGFGRFGVGLLGRPADPVNPMFGVQQGLSSLPLVPATAPMPTVITAAELGCSLLLVVGVLTRYNALAVAGLSGGVFYLVLPAGYAGSNAVTLEVMAITVLGALALALSGAGQLSLERAVLGRELSVGQWLRRRR
jgi:putative oxidoreductase